MGVITSTNGDAAIVALDWPQTRNALGPPEVSELTEAIQAAGRRPDTSAIIITGNNKAFCSGGDLRQIAELTKGSTSDYVADVIYRRFQDLIHALEEVPLPTIAAVDGPAIGLGMDLALACDLKFVGSGGTLAQGWARAGLITGTGGVYFLDRLAPGLTWRLIATGDVLDGATAERHGIAIAVQGSALNRALEAARSLGQLPAHTRQAYVTLERPLRFPSVEFLRKCADLQGELLTSSSFQEFAKKVFSQG